MSVILACDLGGTSFRAALVDDSGEIRAQAVIGDADIADLPARPEMAQLENGWSEIEAEAWWRTLVAACAMLRADAPDLFAAIGGIAICGITRTQVFLDRDGRSLRPAITWKDVRAAGLVPALLDTLPADHPERPAVNAYHPIARLAWLRREEPAGFARLATILDPKDYLNFRLTGRRVSDPVSLARLAASAAPGPDGRSLIEAVGASSAILPTLIRPGDAVGPVLAGLPAPLDRLAGIPVFASSTDTWVGVLGLGAMREGRAYNMSGTTEVFGVMSTAPAAAEGLLTVDWGDLFQLGGPGQNGADTVSWLLSILGRRQAGIGETMQELLSDTGEAQPLLFLPYLQGERTPYWDPSLRGAFVGLNRRHGAGDLARAVLEGVGFLNRIVLERAEAALGRPVSEIRFGGGAAANPDWCQIKADICERPVIVGASPEPGVLGAAILAWTGLGAFGSLDAAQRHLVRTGARYEPDPENRDFYRSLFALFRSGESALAPISRQLAAHAPRRTHPGPKADRP